MAERTATGPATPTETPSGGWSVSVRSDLLAAMAVAGVLWGALYVVAGTPWAALWPWGYSLL